MPRLQDKYRKIVIFPHTIAGEKQKVLIPKFGANVTIFCREEISYRFVKNLVTKAECYLWHDCAFYNDLSKFVKVGQGVLNAFRTDIESGTNDLPANNEDISYNGWCMKPLDEFLNKIQGCEEVRTDRLHVAIAGALLDKRVVFFANSYYQNLAVYEYSLKKYHDIIFIYEKDADLISYNTVNDAFSDYLHKGLVNTKYNVSDLFSYLIYLNHGLWKHEDQARNIKSLDGIVREAKKNIDYFNQLRSDTIRKIDFNLIMLLKNSESNDLERYISESPGMFIDRLSIMYIRRFEVRNLLLRISKDKGDSDLFDIYEHKLRVIEDIVSFDGNYLETLFAKIKSGAAYYRMFNAVKIYNDPRIGKYINN